ncbi:MAG: DNA polymerase III subunit gamma/tau, partial [Phycisphaerae bacterium]|nr:DNA polymerase III subunit gamma/tau [Phycisphaerae bacterium]MDW8262975.1 DNA polymerase III subunit gamma/tau [Phycisphaerales bacterium]
YVVLARKHRSSTFDEVVGQDHVAHTLKRAIETNRIAHAFLFCGTRGVGKTSMARILAKALNCDSFDAPTPNPCGKCTSCTAIARGDDMDVIEIDAASHTQVDKIRELIENSRFRPARARFKVYIIDEVHMLSRGAFNALLKTLEEPPGHVKFILATTETEKVPPTILSRCQRYDFRNIATREIASHLKSICRQEKVKADDEALLLVARAGAGSMRDALSLLDRLLSAGEKHLTVALIEQLLGMPRAQVIFDLAERIGRGAPGEVLELADRLIREGLSPDMLVASLIEHFRNLLLLATCGRHSDLVEVAGLSLDELEAQAKKFDVICLTQSITVLEELRRNLRGTSAGRALLDAVLVRITLAEQFTRIEDLLAGGAALGEKKKHEPAVDSPGAGAVEARGPEPRVTPAPAGVGQRIQNPTGAETVFDEGSCTDDDDVLPAVGKVFAGPTRSLGAIFAESGRASGTSNDARASTTAANLQPVDQAEFASMMSRLRAALARHGPGYDGILVHGRIVSVEAGRAVIRYSHAHEAAARMLQREPRRQVVQQTLSELMNEPVGLVVEVDSDPPDGRENPPNRPNGTKPSSRDASQAAAVSTPPPPAPVITAEQKRAILESDPLVRAACELFDGEIVRID